MEPEGRRAGDQAKLRLGQPLEEPLEEQRLQLEEPSFPGSGKGAEPQLLDPPHSPAAVSCQVALRRSGEPKTGTGDREGPEDRPLELLLDPERGFGRPPHFPYTSGQRGRR